MSDPNSTILGYSMASSVANMKDVYSGSSDAVSSEVEAARAALAFSSGLAIVHDPGDQRGSLVA